MVRPARQIAPNRLGNANRSYLNSAKLLRLHALFNTVQLNVGHPASIVCTASHRPFSGTERL
ncbi:conserved protein of unknown function [Pseudomonas marincola]|uniref:Uncharacterized protein n=1 Tax=Pseudomonas marincola TaxID=437900 RepID=A0A653E4Z1_9PSED|nr:conserved protein of unknown function [Pseudomonas marincola]